MAVCATESQEIIALADARWEGAPAADPTFYRGGFRTQPEKDYFRVKGSSVNINTQFEEAFGGMFNFGLSDRYIWYESTDNKSWNEIGYINTDPIKGVSGESKTIPLDKTGTIRFQVDHQFYRKPLFGNEYAKKDFYSHVATVHVSDAFTPATSATINTDSDYLLNSNSPYFTGVTYAHAALIPKNSTANVKWYSSNNTLANVDETTGKITANADGKSGDLNIIAMINNRTPTPLIVGKSISVGGGLRDQDARLTQSVTFKLLSTGNSTRDNSVNVQWFQSKDCKHWNLLPAQDNQYEYTIKSVTKNNVGDWYHAVLTVKKDNLLNNKDNSYTTNPAKLNVTVPVDPNVQGKTGIINHMNPGNNQDNNTLNHVSDGDVIYYQVTLHNEGYQDFNNAYYTFKLPNDTQVNNVSVTNNGLISNGEYTVSPGETDQRKEINIKLDNFKIEEVKSILVEATVKHNGKASSFVTNPYFHGLETENHNTEYRKFDQPFTLNFDDQEIGKLTPHFKNIKFEPLVSSTKNITDYRTSETNSPNAVVTFDDSRSKKTAVKIYLKQRDKLHHLKEPKNEIDDAQLLFYKYGKSPQDILHNEVFVSESMKNHSPDPIKWDRNSGLLLHMKTCNVPTGEYQATLDWTIQNSV